MRKKRKCKRTVGGRKCAKNQRKELENLGEKKGTLDSEVQEEKGETLGSEGGGSSGGNDDKVSN